MRARASHRYEAHLLVVFLVVAVAALPALASHEVAASTPIVHPSVQLTPARAVGMSRGGLSVRSTPATPRPTPLPTPVPPRQHFTAYIVPPTPPTPAPVVAAAPRVHGGLILWPVVGVITTYYSAGHPAIDIATLCGTPVVAPFSGQVSWAGWRNNGGGNVVEIRDGNRLASLNHLSGYAISAGQQVVAGQVVAYVGMTGNATGCHVHFALFVNGLTVNPLAYLP